MKQFSFKLLTFCLPILLLFSLDAFLPLDFATHRVWEAASVMNRNKILQGPFYPRIKIARTETPDLLYRTQYETQKWVQWETDRYGYRKKDHGHKDYPIMIVGDSNVAGSGVSQENTIAEVLEAEIGMPVYPFAPADINKFLKTEWVWKCQPRVVILATIERNILQLPRPKKLPENFWLRFFKLVGRKLDGAFVSLGENIWVAQMAIYVDRVFYKKALFEHIRAQVLSQNRLNPAAIALTADKNAIAFIEGYGANQRVSHDKIQNVANVIESYHQLFREKGIRFIFLPIPNKEAIYFRYLPGVPESTFLNDLMTELTRRHISVVDLKSLYQDFDHRMPGAWLYDPGDTHWNEKGIAIGAKALAPIVLKELKQS